MKIEIGDNLTDILRRIGKFIGELDDWILWLVGFMILGALLGW